MLRSIHQLPQADRYGTLPLVHRLITEHGLPHWRANVVALLLMGVAASCTSLSAYLVGHVVNEAYLARSYAAIATLCLAAIVVFSLKGLATYGQAVLLDRITTEVGAQMQERAFDKLMRESLGYFSDRPSSAVMAEVTYGAAAVPSVLNMLLTAAGRDSLTLIGLIIVMVIHDPLMSVIGLVIMPPTVFMVRNLVRRSRSVAADQFAGGASIMETIQESLQGIRAVKAFGLEDAMRSRAKVSIEQMKSAGFELAWLSRRTGPLMDALGGCVIALVFLYGGYRVIELGATPGEFISFVTAFLLAYEPAKRLARLHLNLSNSLVGVRILYKLLDAPPTETDEDKPALRVNAGRIEFKAVEFAYRAEAPVIRCMSFIAEPRRVTALVGRSGGGKSTALSLVLRFFDVTAGMIIIDGQDITTVSRKSVREQIAYVGQDVFLFRGSIRDNIRFGKMSAGEGEIVAAAKAAYAHEFISSFPAGYDTSVGEHGLQLSAGQRQRISIARALLKDAPILLLDEPTAALDSQSERHVQDAIGRLSAGRTTLVVAHRLHTIVHAAMIHVIEEGAVVESGLHSELLNRGGRYALLYRMFWNGQPFSQAQEARDHHLISS
jgi:subfamily B ATP-binding cassette protein MsbA